MTSKLPDAEALLPRLAAQLKAEVTPATAMIGFWGMGILRWLRCCVVQHIF